MSRTISTFSLVLSGVEAFQPNNRLSSGKLALGGVQEVAHCDVEAKIV
jgi:hypothetical protein